MRLAKVLTTLKMAQSGSEAQRLIKQGAVLVGGCIPPCNGRMPPYKCVCDGWKKITNPGEDVAAGQVVRIGDGNYRMIKRLDGTAGYDMFIGIGCVPEPESSTPTESNTAALS
jgi:predicted rRNA methylase YqxC with S4 and FtsJ domains